jgi:predicted acylesterase/phospholipase RssA
VCESSKTGVGSELQNQSLTGGIYTKCTSESQGGIADRLSDYFPLMTLRLTVLLWLAATSPLSGQSCPAASTALVLSGGGAKGMAHIGVLRALDSLRIRPDLIVGTSMGAIIGGLYASGYSARQIDSLARSLPLSQLFVTYEPRAPLSLGVLQPAVVWEEEAGVLVFQRAAVRESEVNALLNAGFLRGNLLARGNFDSLPIPFRAVATDLLSGAPVVFAGGDLSQSIRASAAIPFLFEPEVVGGRFLGDGGLAANVPIKVARESGAGRLIVSYTMERTPDSLNLQSTFVLIDHLIGNLFRQPVDSLDAQDLPIRPDVDGFRSLNFSADIIDELITRGFAASYSVLREARCLPSRPESPAILDPPVTSRVTYSEDAKPDSAVFRRLLELNPAQPIEIGRLQQRLRKLGTSDQYASVWLFPSGTRDSVRFHLTSRRVARRVVALGVVYDNDLGGRVWLGQVHKQPFGWNLEATSAAFLGELQQEVYGGARFITADGGRLLPTLELRASRELVRQFSSGDEISPLKVHEGEAFAGVEFRGERGWQSAAGIEARAWDLPGTIGQSSLGARLRITKVGRQAEPLFHLEGVANGEFRRLELEGISTFKLGRLSVRPHGRFAWGDNLPSQLQFVLGGSDGFAGLHIGEQRSQRELSGGLIFLYPVSGPLALRIEPMWGASGGANGILPEGQVRSGIRVGLNLNTGLGPIRVEYGVSEGRRDGLLVRIGRWF